MFFFKRVLDFTKNQGLFQEQNPSQSANLYFTSMRAQKMTDTRRMRQRKTVDTSDYAGRFAVRLRSLRDKAKMSVPELSELTGYPVRNLQRWESGDRQPPINSFPIYAKAFGISIAKLLPKE